MMSPRSPFAQALGGACVAVAIAAACVLPMPAHAQANTGEYLKRIDRDGDGRISPEEYVAWMSHGFDAMDRNRDGILQPEEQPGGRGKPITRAEHRANLLERFRRQDANRDGYLSAKEMAAPPR